MDDQGYKSITGSEPILPSRKRDRRWQVSGQFKERVVRPRCIYYKEILSAGELAGEEENR